MDGQLITPRGEKKPELIYDFWFLWIPEFVNLMDGLQKDLNHTINKKNELKGKEENEVKKSKRKIKKLKGGEDGTEERQNHKRRKEVNKTNRISFRSKTKTSSPRKTPDSFGDEICEKKRIGSKSTPAISQHKLMEAKSQTEEIQPPEISPLPSPVSSRSTVPAFPSYTPPTTTNLSNTIPTVSSTPTITSNTQTVLCMTSPSIEPKKKSYNLGRILLVRKKTEQNVLGDTRQRLGSTPVISDFDKLNLIKSHEWFKDIVGVSEPQFRRLEPRPIYSNDKGLYIKNTTTGKITRAGRFYLISIGDLIQRVCTTRKGPFGGNRKPFKHASIEIIMRHSSDRDSAQFVNVAYLQSLSQNRNAVFQVASNFNGIESIDDMITPSNSLTFTQDYIYDNTQGPAASISAGGSAICRVHAPFYSPLVPSTQWCQTGTQQVNFLEDLSTHFPLVDNGYVHLTGEEPSFPENDGVTWDKLMCSYKIGYHKNAQVTYGNRVNGNLVRVEDRNQIIDQVFCAAYEGSYLSAIKNNRKQLFLTLIGAGSFGNKPEWIYDAILNAHLKWGMHPNNTIKKVYLVLYTSAHYHPEFIEGLRQNDITYSVIMYQGGRPFTEDYYDPRDKSGKDKLMRRFSPKKGRDYGDLATSRSAEEPTTESKKNKMMLNFREEKSHEIMIERNSNEDKTPAEMEKNSHFSKKEKKDDSMEDLEMSDNSPKRKSSESSSLEKNTSENNSEEIPHNYGSRENLHAKSSEEKS